MNEIHVMGVSSSSRYATSVFRWLSMIFDSFCVVSASLFAIHILNLEPFPTFKTLLLPIGLALSYGLLQKKIWGITLGERVWFLNIKNGDKTTLYQRDHLSALERALSALLTLLTCGIALFEVNHSIVHHPLWQKANYWKLDASVPLGVTSSALANSEWLVVPYFYHIGSWPGTFEGKPIFYTLSYELGPPKKFVGKITLHLRDPDIQMIIEGPKTPEGAGTQQELKSCLLAAANPPSFHCALLRYRALSRHLDELQALHPAGWELEWFRVQNPALNEEDQAQGIHLRASGLEAPDSIQDRFILVNSSGAHQALILTRPSNAKGDLAYAMTLKTLTSLRSFKELDAGRAWINRALETIQLERLRTLQDPIELTSQLALIQSLLISKISVEPAGFDSYFHLAGTSLLLATHPKLKGQRETSGIALQNLQSADRFAMDVAPHDSRNIQIEGMLVDAKKALSSEK